MTKFVWSGGEWLDTTGWVPPRRKTPYIITDGMAHAVHPATGQVLDSKSKFREITKQHGLIEVGNDYQTSQTKPVMDRVERKRDIAKAIEQLEGGHVPPPDAAPLEGVETRMFE